MEAKEKTKEDVLKKYFPSGLSAKSETSAIHIHFVLKAMEEYTSIRTKELQEENRKLREAFEKCKNIFH